LLEEKEQCQAESAAMTDAKAKRATRNTSKVKACGYLRTSSAANVGADKDSDKRQRLAIQRFAKVAGIVIADDDWFYDEAVSGADVLGTRPGWNAMMERILGNGVRTVIVEDASRFARELMVQEQGILDLRKAGVTVLTSSGDDLTASNDPGRTMIRQIMGSFSEYEKARLVSKLKAARDRMIEATGRCGGRQGLHVTQPVAVALAKKLHRANPKTGKHMPLRAIAERLKDAGHVNEKGNAYNAKSVKAMIDGPAPATKVQL
jgi:DNA invertase Pin-like site-specific DNA recombinase